MDRKSKNYSDWFGSGNTCDDVDKMIAEHGQPLNVFYESDGYMATLVYADKTVTTGYDGGEYHHTFVCDTANH